MDEMEKLQQIVTGLESRIQLQRAENQKLQDNLNQFNMSKAEKLKEIARLKQVGIDLDNNINQRKEIIQAQDNQEIFNDFMDTLSKELFK